MKYCIRKVPTRNTKYLERLLPEAIIMNDVNFNGCIWSFLKAIKLCNDDAVYIQDDMLLCKNFKERAESYIKKYPNDVISFSTHIPKLEKKRGWYKRCENFSEGFHSPKDTDVILLATYIPKKIADDFTLFMMAEGYKRFRFWESYIKNEADDTLFDKWLELVGKNIFMTIPMLAGHEENKSTVIESRPVRISPQFDYVNCEQKKEGEL